MRHNSLFIEIDRSPFLSFNEKRTTLQQYALRIWSLLQPKLDYKIVL